MAESGLVDLAYLKKLINDIKSGKFDKEIIDTIFPRIEEGVRKSVETALDSFYGSYDQKFYNRSEGFKNVGKVTREGNIIYIDYLPEYADGGYHQDTALVFQNVFMEGYHGGSGGEGSSDIQWRTPYPYYKYWGRSATQSTSIFKLAEREFDIFWETEIRPLALETMEQQVFFAF